MKEEHQKKLWEFAARIVTTQKNAAENPGVILGFDEMDTANLEEEWFDALSDLVKELTPKP